MFCRFFIFFEYMKIICYISSIHSDCKTQITCQEKLHLRMFFPLTDIVYHIYIYIDYPIDFGNLSKQSCWDHTPTSYTTVLRG